MVPNSANVCDSPPHRRAASIGAQGCWGTPSRPFHSCVYSLDAAGSGFRYFQWGCPCVPGSYGPRRNARLTDERKVPPAGSECRIAWARHRHWLAADRHGFQWLVPQPDLHHGSAAFPTAGSAVAVLPPLGEGAPCGGNLGGALRGTAFPTAGSALGAALRGGAMRGPHVATGILLGDESSSGCGAGSGASTTGVFQRASAWAAAAEASARAAGAAAAGSAAAGATAAGAAASSFHPWPQPPCVFQRASAWAAAAEASAGAAGAAAAGSDAAGATAAGAAASSFHPMPQPLPCVFHGASVRAAAAEAPAGAAGAAAAGSAAARARAAGAGAASCSAAGPPPPPEPCPPPPEPCISRRRSCSFIVETSCCR